MRNYEAISMIKDKKIWIKNIYYMLAYADSDLRWEDIKELSQEEFEHIHDMFAEIIGIEIGKLLKRGLHREYIGRQDDLSAMRGKIDMANTIKNKIAKKQKLSCTFDELSENHLLNRIVKETAYILMQSKEVKKDRRNKLKKYIMLFGDIDRIHAKQIAWNQIQFQRNNRSYRMLITFCRFFLESMLLATENGEYKLVNFMAEQKMSALFQNFVFHFYKKEFPTLKVYAPRMEWMVDDDNTAMLPGMQTDIVLEKDEKILMIDTKYYEKNLQKHHGKSTVISAHLYQIFSYVKNMEAKKKKEAREKYGKELNSDSTQISGLLLYAKTEEASQPDGQYKIMGNAIGVKTIGLNQDFAGIRRELGEVVKVGGFMNYDDK